MHSPSSQTHLNYLSRIIPKHSEDLIHSCLESVDSIRQDIFIYQRAITLTNLCSITDYPSDLHPQKKDLPSSIFDPKILTPQEVTPAFLQHSSIMLSFIQANPDVFASAILNKPSKFVTFSLIPTAYGFFTSQEHIESALVFYTHIIRLAKPSMASLLLHPFFCSAIGFRFIEKCLNTFLPKFAAEPKSSPSDHAERLASAIKIASPLLPQPFLTIIHIVIGQKWSQTDLVSLFFVHFFKPQSLAFIEASPHSHKTEQFSKVLNALMASSSSITAIFSTLTSVNSFFEVPQTYRPFEQPYLYFFTTIADISEAARLIEVVTQLPFTLRDVDYKSFPTTLKFKPFWIRVFPKGNKGKVNFRPLIFRESAPAIDVNPAYDRRYRQYESMGMTSYDSVYSFVQSKCVESSFLDFALRMSLVEVVKRAETFETLLWYRLNERLLEQWRGVLEDCHKMSITPLAIEAAREAGNGKFGDALAEATKHIHSNDLQRIQFHEIVQPFISNAAESFRIEFEEINSKWTAFVAKRRLEVDMTRINSLGRASQYSFWESVESLRYLKEIPIDKKFEFLDSCLKNIWKLAKEKKDYEGLLDIALSLAEVNDFVSLFLLFNEFVMKSALFQPHKSDEEMLIWTSLQTYLLKVSDEGLISKVIGLQKRLEEYSAGIMK